MTNTMGGGLETSTPVTENPMEQRVVKEMGTDLGFRV